MSMAERQPLSDGGDMAGFAGCRQVLQTRPASAVIDRQASRSSLAAIDYCLDALECLHVRQGRARSPSPCRVVIDVLVSRGIEPPQAVRAASDTYTLHEALLDWQEVVLEDLLRLRRQSPA